jgi:hypothetical protein
VLAKSQSTTAAVRQKEMNVSMTLLTIMTCTGRLTPPETPEEERSEEEPDIMDLLNIQRYGHGTLRLRHRCEGPFKLGQGSGLGLPTRLADGLGLESTLVSIRDLRP